MKCSILLLCIIALQSRTRMISAQKVLTQVFDIFSDSAVANLYPHKDLSKIHHLLESMHCSGNKFEWDLQMGKFLHENGMQSAWVQEQYFNHLGFRSSLIENPTYENPSAHYRSNFILDSYRSISYKDDVSCKQDDPFSRVEQ